MMDVFRFLCKASLFVSFMLLLGVRDYYVWAYLVFSSLFSVEPELPDCALRSKYKFEFTAPGMNMATKNLVHISVYGSLKTLRLGWVYSVVCDCDYLIDIRICWPVNWEWTYNMLLLIVVVISWRCVGAELLFSVVCCLRIEYSVHVYLLL